MLSISHKSNGRQQVGCVGCGPRGGGLGGAQLGIPMVHSQGLGAPMVHSQGLGALVMAHGGVGHALGWNLGVPDSGAIKNLQAALVRYAQAKGDMNANPVRADGQLNDNTVVAALYVAWKEASRVPGLKSIKNLILQIPGAGDVLGFIGGSQVAMMIAWAGVKAAAPTVTADITNFVAGKANQIAAGIDLASGVGAALPDVPGPNIAQQFVTPVGMFRQTPGAGAGTATKIAAYDPKQSVYRIATAKGVSGASTHIEIGTSAQKPGDATLVDLKTYKAAIGAVDWFKNPVILGGVGIGTVGLALGLWWLLK